ncbi:sugar-binding transcriptional regulator [Aneurinibacillus terranovensis]|uniref:sugar-binding transcriptional regulator n=1 Tax=Aneurinibacillus terranovensis TaxID=278991 RepID=UPI0003F8C9CB|nr:sugar-binding domain-containing protein [Aneurinibacillus terranovensis]
MPDFTWISLLQRISPEAIDMLEKRYRILRQIRLLQPVGRRMLADVLQSTERVIRREVDFLREQQLIDYNRAGMYVTPDGDQMLEEFHPFWKEIGGIGFLEREMAKRLQIRRVVIVPGNADESEWVKDDLARHAAIELMGLLTDDSIVAVTGGTTMAGVANHLHPLSGIRGVKVVPARGALGEEVDIQANTIAARMARELNASYRLLHIPDVMEEEVRRNVKRDPTISDVLDLIENARILMHGIGEAEEMSRRRGLKEEIIHILKERNAVSEVFGYYFNRIGELVYRMSTMGMQMENVEKLDTVLAVAGGKSKAEAILSYIQQRHNYVLVTDEAAMRELLVDGVKLDEERLR